MRGTRGQAFLKEMLAALDSLPEPKLIANDLEAHGEVCAIGAVGKARGVDMTNLDPEDHESLASAFGVAHALACEIMWMNDEWSCRETPEARHARMRQWVADHIKTDEQ
jgi:hypothetical protein